MAHQVVVICSPEDKDAHRQLEQALSVAKRKGLIVLRSTADFTDDAALASAIDQADVLLVLLTQALLDSPQWSGVASQNAKAAVAAHHIPCVPIVVQRCSWRDDWIAQFMALPRDGVPLAGSGDAGWMEVAAELDPVFTGRTPRAAAAPQKPEAAGRQPEAAAPSALDPADLAAIPDAYRRIEQYHQALLRVVDTASRAVEGIVGPLGEKAWTPGELHHPGFPYRSPAGASAAHVPLKHVSYTWASTRDVETGGCRVVLVHNGDGASEGDEGRRPASRSSLSVFATFVVRHQQPRGQPSTPWEHADGLIAAAPRFSRARWEDGGVHVAETRGSTFRFGGFSEEAARVLGAASPAAWLDRLSRLVSSVKGG